MYFSSKILTKESGSRFCKYNVDFLLPGALSEEQFWLLVDISPIHSTKVIIALLDYFVNGKSRKSICETHGINNGYLSTSIARFNQTNQIAKKLSVYYSTHNHT